jgi:hypothetical protein
MSLTKYQIHKAINALLPVLLLIVITAPIIVYAQAPLVPPCDTNCNFNDLVSLVQRIINWLIIIAVPIAAGLFAYAGFLYITSAGDEGKISKAHGIFRNVLIGFIIVLSAWLVVYTITTALLDSDINTFLGN